jgi:hypothetical protein
MRMKERENSVRKRKKGIKLVKDEQHENQYCLNNRSSISYLNQFAKDLGIGEIK